MAGPVRYSEEELAQFSALHQDERASAALYRQLAALSEEHAPLLTTLAETEERHADHWNDLLRAEGRTPTPAAMPWRLRLLVWRARRFGVEQVLPAVIRGEAAARDRYRANPHAPDQMADDEVGHGRALALASNDSVGQGLAMADARHRITAGGALRAAVFGVNDGLVSNLALIMGVAGGTTDPGVILLAGVAGLVAGAGSMAAGEWVSVRSQRELYERELAVERWELEHFPDDEREELELIYRGKGMAAELAADVAEQIMRDPEVALDTLAREELGLNPGDLGSPWAAAVSSFGAFAVGAIVPLVPFLFDLVGTAAVVVSALLSAVALTGVGATLSVFTGRPAWRSGLRMVLIGGGAAAATYLIGSLVGVTLD